MNAILDWITREGAIFVAWWLLVAAAGLAALPWCWRLLGALPDKGYTLARTVGLVLVGFVFWLLASLGLLPNTPGAILLAWLLVVGIGVWVFRQGEPFDWGRYWREQRAHILVAEALFFVLFLGWTIFRAYQNDTSTTEKPMELAFISGILRSDTFPPNDPWMAGYAISYYHFGYILAAMLTMVSGISSAIGFSMTNALWFALTGLTAYGVVYNMVRSRAGFTIGLHRAAIGAGLLACVLLNFLSNFQFPLIEVPYQSGSMPPAWFDYWATQDRSYMGDMYVQANAPLTITNPETWSYWWFFRASRVLTDFELDGSLMPGAQPIDEFPAFSFLLGDVHPHVLALPFVLLVLGLALHIVLQPRDPTPIETLFYALVAGALIFLNTWDAPIFLTTLVGAAALRRLVSSSTGTLTLFDWGYLIRFGFMLVAVALLAYLPFIIGFRSQAAGPAPNPLYPTYFPQFFIMFGPLLLLGGAFVLVELWRGTRLRRMNWSLGWSAGVLVGLGLFVLMIVMTAVGALISPDAGLIQDYVNRSGGWAVVIPQALARRLAYLPTTLLLVLTLVVLVARLFPRLKQKTLLETDAAATHDVAPIVTYAPATGFALLLVGVAAITTLAPEFIYLRDNFGTRINTIFKFYYQAWITLSLASAYGAYAILTEASWRRPAGVVRAFYGGLLALVLALGLPYFIFGVHARTMIETNRFTTPAESLPPLTLDGGPRMVTARDDYDAVMCLSALVGEDEVVVVEAVRHAYRSNFARVAALTGIPILLGWENHERQWRGVTYNDIAGTRAPDIELLYNDPRWEMAVEIIQRYQIDYIMYGLTERQLYAPEGEEKFMDHLDMVCEYGDARVYRVPPRVLTETVFE